MRDDGRSVPFPFSALKEEVQEQRQDHKTKAHTKRSSKTKDFKTVCPERVERCRNTPLSIRGNSAKESPFSALTLFFSLIVLNMFVFPNSMLFSFPDNNLK